MVHPLIAELRQGRATLASLLSRITLPEGDDDSGTGYGWSNVLPMFGGNHG